MSKNKHKFLTFAALMTGATVAVHFINHTIATAAQLKQMLHISNDNYFFDKITDHLNINKICIGNAGFVRTSAS